MAYKKEQYAPALRRSGAGLIAQQRIEIRCYKT